MSNPNPDVQAVSEDCSDLLAVRNLWFPCGDPSFDAAFRAWWSGERHHRQALVAYVDDAPVGMANAQIFTRMPAAGREAARWLYVANVYVAETHRRRGIARLLMETLLDFARANGMVRAVLAPSEMSIPLYASLGFRAADDLMRIDFTQEDPP